MGQYHFLVNLDKMQFVHPHKLGNGLKLWEQLASHPGTGAALIALLASKSNGQGDGDLKEHPLVGSWCGDRIAFVGDYDDQSKYKVGRPKGRNGRKVMSGAKIYGICEKDPAWTDISMDVCAILESELDGKFEGDGWRRFTQGGQKSKVGMKPDMLLSLNP